MTILPRPVADFRRVGVPLSWIPEEKRMDDRGVMGVQPYFLLAPYPWNTTARRLMSLFCRRYDFGTARISPEITLHSAAASRLTCFTPQDYGDHTRKASNPAIRDRMIFWNPGSAFVTREEMFTPGDRPVRNPRIVNAFRRIGLGEQAGTGNWRHLC